MVQINCIGELLGSSGYSSHYRNLCNALNKIVPVRLSTRIPQGANLQLTDAELEMIKRQPVEDEINLIISMPQFWRMYATAKINYAYLIWEGSSIPTSFINECLNPDITKIICPSTHTLNAIKNTLESLKIENSGILEKTYVVPHGVNPELFYPKEIKHDKFTFLCSKGWRSNLDRGGNQYAIRAFLEEFKDKDDIQLLIHINQAYGVPNVQSLINELLPRKTDLPIIIVNADMIPYEKLNELYNQCDVFVMPTRAEAFGIPGIEAMACGKPAIATNYGGQTDYINEKNGWLVDYDLSEVKHELIYEGVKWATPKISELRKAMREAYNNRDLVKQKGMEALKTSKEFTWSNTAERIKSI